jgi:hypothetical protein
MATDSLTTDAPKSVSSIIGAAPGAANWNPIIGHLSPGQGVLEIGSILGSTDGSADTLTLTVPAAEAQAGYILLERADTGTVGVDASVARTGSFVGEQLVAGAGQTMSPTLLDTLRRRGILIEGAANYVPR